MTVKEEIEMGYAYRLSDEIDRYLETNDTITLETISRLMERTYDILPKSKLVEEVLWPFIRNVRNSMDVLIAKQGYMTIGDVKSLLGILPTRFEIVNADQHLTTNVDLHGSAIDKTKEPSPCPSDRVNHPSHYTFGEIEVIDYIRDKLTDEEFVGYCNGNVIKYVSRWRHKGGLEDLKKARVYLNWAIERQECKKGEEHDS